MMEQMLPLNLAILQCALNAQCTQPIVHCAHLQNSIPHILVLNVHGPVQHVQAPRPALHVLQASLQLEPLAHVQMDNIQIVKVNPAHNVRIPYLIAQLVLQLPPVPNAKPGISQIIRHVLNVLPLCRIASTATLVRYVHSVRLAITLTMDHVSPVCQDVFPAHLPTLAHLAMQV